MQSNIKSPKDGLVEKSTERKIVSPIDIKQASGLNISSECLLLLHRIMQLNKNDSMLHQELQRAVNILFDRFPNSLPKQLLAKNGNGHG